MIFVYVIIGSLLLGLSEVIRYHIEPKTLNQYYKKKLNWAWHIYRDLGLLGYMIVAWQLPRELNEVWYYIPILWGIHWTLTDGIQNILKGKWFFWISNTSGNWAEKLGIWYVKVAWLLAGVSIVIVKNYKEREFE